MLAAGELGAASFGEVLHADAEGFKAMAALAAARYDHAQEIKEQVGPAPSGLSRHVLTDERDAAISHHIPGLGFADPGRGLSPMVTALALSSRPG